MRLATLALMATVAACGDKTTDPLVDQAETPTSEPGQQSTATERSSCGKIYWSNWVSIFRFDLDNVRETETLFTLPFSKHGLIGVALDHGRGKIYWLHGDLQRIQRANLDGSQAENVLIGLNGIPVSGPVLDVAAHKIYWTDYDTAAGIDRTIGNYRARIRRANFDGSGLQDVVVGLQYLHARRGLALDPVNQKLYWPELPHRAHSTGDITIPARIQRANLDGSQVETVFPLLDGYATDLALDVEAGKVYWGAPPGRIQRANLDGSQVKTLVVGADTLHGLKVPHSLTLDLSGGKIYWLDWEIRFIQRANLDGSQVEIYDKTSNAIALALDVDCR